MNKPFEISDNQFATVLRIYGRTFAELIGNIAKAISAAMVSENKQTGESLKHTLQVRAVDEETLMMAWVSELLELIYMDNFVITSVSVNFCSTNEVKAELSGYRADSFERELGEVLVDETAVEETKNGFEATLVFDD